MRVEFNFHTNEFLIPISILKSPFQRPDMTIGNNLVMAENGSLS